LNRAEYFEALYTLAKMRAHELSEILESGRVANKNIHCMKQTLLLNREIIKGLAWRFQ
jgi:hypothetical protein